MKRIEQENLYQNGQSVGHGFEMKPTEWYVHRQVDSDLGE